MNKVRQLERNRFSIFTDDLNYCYICHTKKDHLHEVIFGKNRQNSMKYGLVIPLCARCHERIHSDINEQLKYKRIGQMLFIKNYPTLDFISIFHRNYIEE